MIQKFPSLIEFYGYVFFFASFLVGPAFDFRDYQKYISREAPFDNIPSPVVPTLKCLLYGFVSMFIMAALSKPFGHEFCLTREFLYEWPLWKKLRHNIMSLTFIHLFFLSIDSHTYKLLVWLHERDSILHGNCLKAPAIWWDWATQVPE